MPTHVALNHGTHYRDARPPAPRPLRSGWNSRFRSICDVTTVRLSPLPARLLASGRLLIHSRL